MSYLEFKEYLKMGGTLEKSAFDRFSLRAERIIKRQANGRTGARIDGLSVIPNEVKNCMFEIIEKLNSAPAGNISSESTSTDGVSQSVTYKTNDTNKDIEQLIHDYLIGIEDENGVSILYLGAF